MVGDTIISIWCDNCSQDLRNRETAQLCSSIIRLIASEKYKDVEHLPLALFFNELNIPDQQENLGQLMKVLEYLSSRRMHLLDMKYMLHDDDYSEPLYLEEESISEALFDGVLYHPETGEPVDNYKSKVFPYFVQSKMLKSAHS